MQVARGKWHSLLRFSCLQENCVSWRKKVPLMGFTMEVLLLVWPWWLHLGRMAVCLYFHNSFSKQNGFFLSVSFIIPPSSQRVWHSYHLSDWGKPSSALNWSLPPEAPAGGSPEAMRAVLPCEGAGNKPLSLLSSGGFGVPSTLK